MIEQTEMMATEWQLHAAADTIDMNSITNYTTLAVMKKRAATKKGISYRLSCRFVSGKDPGSGLHSRTFLCN